MFRFFWERLRHWSRQAQSRQARRVAHSWPRRFRPLLEELENRLVLSTLVSTTAQLRTAITNINTGATTDHVIDLAPGTYNTEADAGGTLSRMGRSPTAATAPASAPSPAATS